MVSYENSRRSNVLVIVLLLLVSGCSAFQQKDAPKTWMDMSEIKEQISKTKEQSSVIDAAEALEETEAAAEPKTKDLSAGESPVNRYLRLTPKPPAAAPKEVAEGEGVLLNFDNADIYEVIQVVAELLDLNYIIDPQVKGVVNIRSGKKIPKNQLFSVFKKILNINGLDIRQEGDYSLISLSEKPMAQSFIGPDSIYALSESSKVVMQVMPISYLTSSEAMQLINPYLSKQGAAYNMGSQNTLIILDYEGNVLDILRVLSQIDISPLSNLKVRMVRVDKAPLFTLRDELMEILKTMGINKSDYQGVSIIPLERVNSLLIMSNNEFLLNNTMKWIQELDNVPLQGRDNIYIYNVRNSVASELAELVNALISGDSSAISSTTNKNSQSPKNPAALESTQEASKPAFTLAGLKKSDGGTGSTLRFAGTPLLLADDSRNVILLRALPADYNRLMKLLERLDNLPRQVLVEVIVAEVTLSDSWEMGIEWAMHNNKLKINDSRYGQYFESNFENVGRIGSDFFGFSYSILDSSADIVGLLHAVGADNDITILSSPQIMVLNNESATVNVGQEVPIVTTEALNDTTGGSNTRTIQYRDTGVILTVTPRINYNGVIILDIEQQVSEAQEGNLTSGIDSPVIFKRELKTKLAVKDGQSILMGGLIDKKLDNGRTGVPLLMDIPLLGWLFKYQKEKTDRTELMVMITPYVIESENVLEQYIMKFKGQVNEIRKDLAKRPD